MKRSISVALAVAWLSVSAAVAWVRIRSEIRPTRPPIVVGPAATTKHTVTPEMAGASLAMTDRPAPVFSRPDADGRMQDLEELLKQGPVLLTFIKFGCPCSEAAQPFFNRLHAAYPRVSFLGVIDVASGPARKWASDFHATYPLVLDPDLAVTRGYRAENSAYVVLIDPRGHIVQQWPGYSRLMLQELSARLANMTGSTAVSLDLTDAPSELYTGCPYGI